MFQLTAWIRIAACVRTTAETGGEDMYDPKIIRYQTWQAGSQLR